MESFEEVGCFWLPEQPDKPIAGILKYDRINGAELKLIGCFDKKGMFGLLSEDFDYKRIILGLISEGEVTLHKCLEFHSHEFHSSSSTGFSITCFKVNEIFVGHHFKREGDIKFNNISVNYSNLNEWAGITGFKHRWELDEGKLVGHEWKYFYPKVIENRLNAFDINISYYFVGGRIDNFELNSKQNTLIDIHTDDSLTFLDFHKILTYIQDFLSLGVGEAVCVRYMTGRSEEAKTERLDGKIIYDNIKIYFSTVVTESRKKLSSDEMFFTLGDLDNLEECLNNWFNKLEDLKPVYDLYFSTLYHPKMYLQLNFLNYAQALESYHRRMYGGTYMSNGEYKRVYNVLADQIHDSVNNKDHKQSLEKRIEYGNEFSLRKRLNEIFKIIGDDITTKIIENKNNFIKDVVKTRNYYTHYSKELEEEVPDTKKLLKLTQKLKFLVEICFLVELDLSTDKIKEIIDRDRKHNYKIVE